nr:McyA2 [Myxococcus sp.]
MCSQLAIGIIKMNVQPPKKLFLKKDTLRQIDSAQLDGAVGGTTPVTIIPFTIGYTIGRTLIEAGDK